MIPFTYIVISDIHLGHKHNPTKAIINNLKAWLNSIVSKQKTDALFIAGDLFDGLLNYPSTDAYEATMFVSWLLDWCDRYKLLLRVLEGTPSHDWKQSKIFELLASTKTHKVNFRYISSLEIEHVMDFNLHVLYVPDEWRSDTSITLSEVKQLLIDKNIDQVDIAIMHGQFTYQLPAFINNIPRHSETEYMALVRYFINIGHIHHYSVYDRIIASGSFDRLAHGEEETKGGVVCVIDTNPSHRFISNDRAKVFITLDITNLDIKQSQELIDHTLEVLPDNSYVRLKANSDNTILCTMSELKLKYPFIYFSKLANNIPTSHSLFATKTKSKAIAITSDNIVYLINESLQVLLHNQPMCYKQAVQIVHEVINADTN